MNHYTLRVLKGKRIALPKEWCAKNDVKEGDFIQVIELENSIRIIPVVIMPKLQFQQGATTEGES